MQSLCHILDAYSGIAHTLCQALTTSRMQFLSSTFKGGGGEGRFQNPHPNENMICNKCISPPLTTNLRPDGFSVGVGCGVG